jgi:N-acetylmuramoyl-L-alanine amidase
VTIKIKIDPGHGGKDPGAVANGLQEKDVVLTIAKKTAAYLNNNYSNVQATLTRSTDIFHELSKRADTANNDGADYFVSVHLNSFNADSHGFETFRQPGKGSATAAFQKAVHEEIISFLQPFGIQDRQTKQKNLAVLRETTMPAVLTENLFVSNPKEATLLKNAAFLDGLAKAHADGIPKGAKLVKKASASYRIYTGTFKDDASARYRYIH